MSHPESLFESLLSLILPDIPSNSGTLTQEQRKEIAAQMREHMERRKQHIVRTEIPHFGTMEEFTSGGRKAVLLKTLEGGHNGVGELEGVHEIIRKVFYSA